jgi:putative hydrolase of the HAD superfamily
MPPLGPAPERAPRAVIFDIGRVIIRIDLSRSMGALGQRDGLTHAQVLRALEADARWEDWEEGRMTPHDWHAHLAKKLGFSYDFQEFCAIWNSVLAPDPILPDALFEGLAAKCRLALLSNTDPLHVAHFEATHAFPRHFPVRVYSCRVGVCKPSPVIFHHTLRELGALPEEALFIDDLRENVLAATALGVHGFHFTDAEDLLAEFSRLKLWAP